MMMECITIAGFMLAIFMAGIAVGKLVEKVERHISEKEDEEHGSKHKNDRYADIGIKVVMPTKKLFRYFVKVIDI